MSFSPASAVTQVSVPAEITLVRDFVNTVERQVGLESLSSPDAVRTWFVDRGLLPAGATLVEADLARALAVREGLRNVLQAHAGHEADDSSLALLHAALAEVPLQLAFDATAQPSLVAIGADPFQRALGAILQAIHVSIGQGTWDRLKVCVRDSCQWAFYDTSRNHSGRWCSMAGCGNQAKMKRAYAARKRRAAETARPDEA